MAAAPRAQREDDRGGHRGGSRERCADAHAATARAAHRQRGRRELGCEARIESRRHPRRQRHLAEAGELTAHLLELVVRGRSLDARVIHVR
jgi:hypothetical protein